MAAKKKAAKSKARKTVNQPLLNRAKAELDALLEAQKNLDLRLRALRKNLRRIILHHFT